MWHFATDAMFTLRDRRRGRVSKGVGHLIHV